MKIRHSFVFYLASLSATPVVGGYNLYFNFENNLYAIEHDTIAIPFAAIVGTLFILLLLLVLQRPYRLRKSKNVPQTLLEKSASIFATAVTAVLLLDHIVYWAHPSHLPTFLIFLAVFCFYVYHQLQIYGVVSAGTNH
ncbi:hypothetical protein [Pseudomonas citrulli]|uniref:hypothetical protein n=1 Tax=Pseudomonas citrulli TaxID=3064347 RepID=UPI00350F8556